MDTNYGGNISTGQGGEKEKESGVEEKGHVFWHDFEFRKKKEEVEKNARGKKKEQGGNCQTTNNLGEIYQEKLVRYNITWGPRENRGPRKV